MSAEGGMGHLDRGQRVEQGLIVPPAVQQAAVHDTIFFEDGEVRIHAPIHINCITTVHLSLLETAICADLLQPVSLQQTA